ncbi:BZ3500_MvSof-1268-A1-R1_Chr6-3g09024 [Microbotryum saponariae]|uniref:BZ3500_MvSof-1268-A1-R1_Chr6-3g09024 protein n=1 Tax=Microbotryum saponariae TaxID=289078 RepID=A0A2X0KM80_9BASI|nr:BZ3500_MvSof-1268-A1-R1_Chr6-3g09024 [Microbotryum saponariae]SDA07626.1 BZ3501_MvSof-1269-A2-R1_Chr6-2g08728 [Microbotryum saponariae]
MQLSRSQRTLDQRPNYVDASLERPRSDTGAVILIALAARPMSVRCSAFLRSRIDAHVTRPTSPHPEHPFRPVTISSATPTLFTRVVNLGGCRNICCSTRRIFDRCPSAPITDFQSDPPVDRPNRQTFKARSPPARAHLITTTCEVTVCSPLVTAASTTSTINLPPHSCSIAMDSLSSTDLLAVSANPRIAPFSTHLASSPIATLDLSSS